MKQTQAIVHSINTKYKVAGYIYPLGLHQYFITRFLNKIPGHLVKGNIKCRNT